MKMDSLRDRDLVTSLLPAATIVIYSIGFFLSEMSIADSIEKDAIAPVYWLGIAVMAAAAALLIVLNTCLRLSIAQILGLVILRTADPAVRHPLLFGADVWWHYGLVQTLRGQGQGASIDSFLYPAKGSQIFMASLANLLGIDTLTVMRFAYIPFTIASDVLLFLISLRLFRSLRLASVSFLFLAVAETIYLGPMPETFGLAILLGAVYCTIRSLDQGRLRWTLAAASLSFLLLYVHHFSWLILVATYVLSVVAFLNVRLPSRQMLFLVGSSLASVPPQFFFDAAFRLFLNNMIGQFSSRIIPLDALLALAASFAASLLAWPRIQKANQRISKLQSNPSCVIGACLVAALAFFFVLGSGYVLVPAGKTFLEFIGDNLFNITFVGISLSGLVYLLWSRGVKSSSGRVFLLSWLLGVAAFFFFSLSMPLLDPVRYPPILYFPMAVCGTYTVCSLHQRGKKMTAACLLMFLAFQPLFYVPPIHTAFRPGMTYELFPAQTVRAASWMNSFASGEVVGTDIRLSSLVYGYSTARVNASFSYAIPMNLAFLDTPAVQYGLGVGYFGLYVQVPAATSSRLNSSLYRRVYDNGAAWSFSPTIPGAVFYGSGDAALVKGNRSLFGPTPQYASVKKEASPLISATFGAASGFLLGLALLPTIFSEGTIHFGLKRKVHRSHKWSSEGEDYTHAASGSVTKP